MGRVDLVSALKNKINNEVVVNIAKIKKDILSDNISDENFIYGCKLIVFYVNIQEYINNEDSFMGYSSKTGDAVDYYIENSTLQMWLQDSFDWCRHWAQAFGITFMPISDFDLEFRLGTVLDQIIFERKCK